jgi:hypothetical protein
MSAPKQRKITIHTEACNASNPYTTINLEALEDAMGELIPVYPAAFELWVYFSKNRDGYYLEVSSKDIIENYGISKDRYQKAWKILVQYGYIVEQSSTAATFYQKPQKQENPAIEKQENPAFTNIQKQENPAIEKQENPARNINSADNTLIQYNGNISQTSSAPWEPQAKILDFQIFAGLPPTSKRKKGDNLWELQHQDGTWGLYTLR